MAENDDGSVRLVEQEFLTIMNQLRAIHGYPPLTELPEPPYCPFCGRSKKEMGALVEGLDAHICAECTAEARKLLLRG